MKKWLLKSFSFLEERNLSLLGLILVALGIGVGFWVTSQEVRLYRGENPRTGSGLFSGFSILSGSLLQIARQFKRSP